MVGQKERKYLNNLALGKDTLIFVHLQDHLKLHIIDQVKNTILIKVVTGWLKLFVTEDFDCNFVKFQSAITLKEVLFDSNRFIAIKFLLKQENH